MSYLIERGQFLETSSVLVLKFEASLSNKEIAEDIGCNEISVVSAMKLYINRGFLKQVEDHFELIIPKKED